MALSHDPFQAGAINLASELERDAAHDQGEEQQNQSRIEIAEHQGIGGGKGRKGSAAGGKQPDFVAVPDRADGIDQDTLFRIVLCEKAGQETGAEDKAVEHEIDCPQDTPQHEPDDLEY